MLDPTILKEPKYPSWRRQKDIERKDNGCLVMDEGNLRLICEKDGLSEFPDLNNKIYLHFKVIDKIQGLDKYVNLKALYLENNVISVIQNLDALVNLENLFLQNNMVKKIENLDKLKELKILNLNNNSILQLSGLSELRQLQTFSVSHNFLETFDDLEHLGTCSETLSSLDLSHNKIIADGHLFDLIPQIKCLYLQGNPLVRDMKFYRRTVIGNLKNLVYLDERGIDSEERITAEAYVMEGSQGFKNARETIMTYRKQIKDEKKKDLMQNIDVHRNRKIRIFLQNIKEYEDEIVKLRVWMHERENAEMVCYYENRIAELYEKIRQTQVLVDGINKRINDHLKQTQKTEDSPEKVEEKEIQTRHELPKNENPSDLQTEAKSASKDKEITEDEIQILNIPPPRFSHESQHETVPILEEMSIQESIPYQETVQEETDTFHFTETETVYERQTELEVHYDPHRNVGTYDLDELD